MHAPPPIVGFIGGGLSTIALWLADAVSPVSRDWVEVGGTLGLIGCLSYGCITLWKELQSQKKQCSLDRERHQSEVAMLHNEILGETRRQNAELIAVLNKLDPDKK